MMQLKKLALAAVLSFSIFSLPAAASTPTDASIIQLMEVANMDGMLKELTSAKDGTLTNVVMAGFENALPEGKLNAKQKQLVIPIIQKYTQKVYSDDFVNELSGIINAEFIRIYKKYFTQEEVDQLIAFYNSKVGQSMVKKQPIIMQEYMSSTMPIIMKKTQQRYIQYMPQIIADVETVIKSAE